MMPLMRSRLFWRRSAAAAGTYSSAVLGFLGTIVAYHVFSTRTFGLYAIVLAAAGFFQTLLDLTMEEALIKFGFRYVTREDWGRLRRLFTSAIGVKLTGGVVATIRDPIGGTSDVIGATRCPFGTIRVTTPTMRDVIG